MEAGLAGIKEPRRGALTSEPGPLRAAARLSRSSRPFPRLSDLLSTTKRRRLTRVLEIWTPRDTEPLPAPQVSASPRAPLAAPETRGTPANSILTGGGEERCVHARAR